MQKKIKKKKKIAYVHMNTIDECLDALVTDLPKKLQGLLNWFEDSNVGHWNRHENGRHASLFHPEI